MLGIRVLVAQRYGQAMGRGQRSLRVLVDLQWLSTYVALREFSDYCCCLICRLALNLSKVGVNYGAIDDRIVDSVGDGTGDLVRGNQTSKR